MIPEPEGCYEKIDFNLLEKDYAVLMKKEYRFCLGIKEKLIKKVDKIYNRQKNLGIIDLAYCSFILLEDATCQYLENKVNKGQSFM